MNNLKILSYQHNNVKNSSDKTLQLSVDQALINFLKLYKKVNNNQFDYWVAKMILVRIKYFFSLNL